MLTIFLRISLNVSAEDLVTLVSLRVLPGPQPFYKRMLNQQVWTKKATELVVSLCATRQELNTKRNRKKLLLLTLSNASA